MTYVAGDDNGQGCDYRKFLFVVILISRNNNTKNCNIYNVNSHKENGEIFGGLDNRKEEMERNWHTDK